MRPVPSSPSQSVRDRPITSRAAAGPGWVGLLVAAGLSLPLGFPAGAHAKPPGPESFGKTPTTALELWDAADYLVRTGQPGQAVPYLNQFLKANPDDATLMQIRDRYGVGSILRLQDYPETRALAAPLAGKLGEATRRHATSPDRINRFIADLGKTREEQDYAVERLREAGPFAVPALLGLLDNASLGPEDHAQVVRNMGRLDLSAVPALIAALDAPKPRLAADTAEVLGLIGDPRAVPALTALAADPDPQAPVVARDAARRAVERITGRAFDAQPRTPARLLTGEARRYHLHAIRFPGDPVIIWAWDAARQAPAPRSVTRSEAEAYFGLKLARAALAVDPSDRRAQAVAVATALEKAVERVGLDRFPAGDPTGTFGTAVAAGPAVLGDVLRAAIADRKYDLAAAAAEALGRVTDANALAVEGSVNPLVAALSAPGRRARFAAARALILLDPRAPFAGSSRVVPVLAQFVTAQAKPRALVIDGNPARGGQLTGFLHALGYDPVLAPTGDEGFRVASGSADVDLILIDHHMILGDWRLHDTLANLRADALTAGIPVYVVGPLARRVDLNALLTERFPGVRFLVTPSGPQVLEQQLAIAGRPPGLSEAERVGYAREAAALLARVAARPNSPFEPDLARVEPALSAALHAPGTSLSASAALGDVPDQDAQRGLADAMIDPAGTAPLRLGAAGQLARSIQRFGPLVAADQEVKIVAAFDAATDPAMRTALGTVLGALRPGSAPVGLRLRRLGSGAPAGPNPNTPPASPSPEATPSPSEPGPEPAAPAPAAEPVPAPEAKP